MCVARNKAHNIYKTYYTDKKAYTVMFKKRLPYRQNNIYLNYMYIFSHFL